MIKVDQYNLKAAPQEEISGNNELHQNLSLSVSVLSDSGVIQGTVTSGSPAAPVEGATVKVFSTTGGLPLYHATTNSQGKYVIPSVSKGSYYINAIKEGYIIPLSVPITVSANQPVTKDIFISVDPDATLNTIYGRVLTSGEGNIPLDKAMVDIFQVVDGERSLFATTYTNSDGEYLLPYVPTGNYVVEAFKENYVPEENSSVTLTTSQKTPVDFALTPLAAAQFGTVSGFITEEKTGNPIVNAVVGLYQIINGEEVLIQQMKTNGDGRYLFGNVAAGTVFIKAFAQQNYTPE